MVVVTKGEFSFHSANQAKVYASVMAFFEEYGVVPSCMELCKLQGWRSSLSGFEALQRLERNGLLVRHVLPGGRKIYLPVGKHRLNVKPVKVPK